MKYQEIQRRIYDTIKDSGKHYCDHAAVKINGQIKHLKEVEIRALQVAVVDMTDKEYEDFCASVIIYNGSTVENSTGIITIERDGGLSDAFITDFFSLNDKLAIALFRRKPILK